MSWLCQCENGCVPADAIFNPLRSASSASLLRNSVTWARASTTDWQIWVPSSTTDWCISGLICSLSVTFPPSRISWMCDRSSRVSGSMIANSSSMPRVNVCCFALIRGSKLPSKTACCHPVSGVGDAVGVPWEANRFPYRFGANCAILRELTQLAPCHCRLQVFTPAQIITPGFVLARFADCHFGDRFDHPFEICLTDVRCFRIRRGIAKINGDRHAVANRKLDRVQVVTKKLVQCQHILLDSFEDFFRRLPFGLIPQVIRMPRLVRHDAHVPLID